ncbi:MAG: outer membrane beta-barrel protein [Acetobacteraceae bacterium]|nr:outer membrane beta-barrel protein [Acetobacteraceae bacterium]
MLDQLFPEGVPGYDTAPGVTVRSRLRPEDTPLGTRIGGFVVRPQLETGFGYDDNVLGGSAPQGSWLVRTRPSLAFGSDWSRHAVGGFVSLDDTRYLDTPSQSRTDDTVSLGGALDIGRDRLTLAAAHLDQHEGRNQIDALPSDRPVFFTLDDARVTYTATFTRWTLTPTVEVSRWQYQGTTIFGQPASQAYRDRTVVQGGMTLGYQLAPLRSLLLVTRAIGQGYPHTPTGQASLNSVGYQMLVGLDYDNDAVWRYRLLVGGEMRQFAAFPTRNAFIAEADVAWMPTGMTTLHATLARSIEDAAQEGVAGFTYTSARLTIDHEYLRDLLLTASVGVQQAAYLQGGQQDGYSFGVGATWLVNRSVRLSATYDLTSFGAGTGVGTGTVAGAGSAASPMTGASTRSLALLMLRLGL